MNWQQQRRAQATIFAQQRTVGKGNAAPPQRSVSCMHVTEQMISRFGFKHLFPQHLAAIMDGHAFYSVLVQHMERRLVRNQHIHTGRNSLHAAVLKPFDEERQAIERHAFQRDALMRKKMAVGIQPIHSRAMQASVVVAKDEDFMTVRKIAQPVRKVQCLVFRTVHAKVAAMHQHVGFRQVAQPAVETMRVRKKKKSAYHLSAFFIHGASPQTSPKLPFFIKRSYSTMLPATDTLSENSPGICTTLSHCANTSADNPSRSEPNK